MEAADQAGNAGEKGFQIAVELIHKIKRYHHQGINGIHLMPVGWDAIIPVYNHGGGSPAQEFRGPGIEQSIIIPKRGHMHTILKSNTREVVIGADKPFVIIGEKINPTGIKKLGQALVEQNFDYVKQLAKDRSPGARMCWM